MLRRGQSLRCQWMFYLKLDPAALVIGQLGRFWGEERLKVTMGTVPLSQRKSRTLVSKCDQVKLAGNKSYSKKLSFGKLALLWYATCTAPSVEARSGIILPYVCPRRPAVGELEVFVCPKSSVPFFA
jgi:hypothetical protein